MYDHQEASDVLRLSVDGYLWDVSNLCQQGGGARAQTSVGLKKSPPPTSSSKLTIDEELDNLLYPSLDLYGRTEQSRRCLSRLEEEDEEGEEEEETTTTTDRNVESDNDNTLQLSQDQQVPAPSVGTTTPPHATRPGYLLQLSRNDDSFRSIQSDLTENSMEDEKFETDEEEEEKMVLEVMPGLELALHGSQETNDAIASGCITTTTCLVCHPNESNNNNKKKKKDELGVISCARYVLCPTCKCVSPVEQSQQQDHSSSSSSEGGVGLGFYLEHH